MYKLQERPTKEIILERGGKMTPFATLKDEYGGIAHICNDDHCYVLYLGHRGYRLTTHWFKEAVAVLGKLPLPK